MSCPFARCRVAPNSSAACIGVLPPFICTLFGSPGKCLCGEGRVGISLSTRQGINSINLLNFSFYCINTLPSGQMQNNYPVDGGQLGLN